MPFAATAGEPVEILMKGTANGSKVWFDPIGIRVVPGTVIRWRNNDPGNSHTATAFHPRNSGHPLRIPAGARPWNSGYLLPDETFSMMFTVAGVYDYFCIPHEMAGMVGRIVVAPHSEAVLPVAAEGLMDAFPSVPNIMRLGRIHKEAQ
ncbi:plastocyanin/azurin family copper-binding protein (plasmid) [Phyllobacterium sp. A18/5-2]|uniref:plastocyanin/azurin family copper-binding protein n=1 Tax=Phyllobacterium sp. A18/5-2 TaxID=2978392 RepID=UPI0021C5928E|nr:plastocyanin/azurin family copper-binding protein [Phyllobacterium sp. A18/5-2]UXN66102.1 plastocyanin/azurin family copper-binding protein [Phyllobacterium sp. A18/5-2]